MLLLLTPLHNITITFTNNKKNYKYFTNKNHRQYLKDGCNHGVLTHISSTDISV